MLDNNGLNFGLGLIVNKHMRVSDDIIEEVSVISENEEEENEEGENQDNSSARSLLKLKIISSQPTKQSPNQSPKALREKL